MTILSLALYALLASTGHCVILLATLAADKPCGDPWEYPLDTLARGKARALANEVRWRWCRFWHTQVKWRLGKSLPGIAKRR